MGILSEKTKPLPEYRKGLIFIPLFIFKRYLNIKHTIDNFLQYFIKELAFDKCPFTLDYLFKFKKSNNMSDKIRFSS